MTAPVIHEIDVLAWQALLAGKASEAQQKQATAHLLQELCQVSGACPDDASERQAAIFEGRRQVGVMILKMQLGSTLDAAKDFDAKLKGLAATTVRRGRKQGQ